MITKRALGIYSGQNYISVAEVVNKKLTHYFNTPHSFADFDPQGQNIPEEIKLTAVLQRSLRDKNIESTSVHMCVRTKDIILRSFFIPWMMPNEVKGVVEFEINRYIPFKLEELIYHYHSTIIKEDKTKRIRILFVAVRKDLLEKYCGLLEQANLKIVNIEPEPLSLVRLLLFKKLIQNNQITAIIQTDQKEGTITLVEGGIPQFVREFRLVVPTQTHLEGEREILKTRLFNEIRISLDYYARQHTQNRVDKVLFLSTIPSPEIAEKLSQDLSIPTTATTPRAIIEGEEDVPLGMLNAFGVGLKDNIRSVVDIDLLKARSREPATDTLKFTFDTTRISQVGAVCGSIILASFIFANYQTAAQQGKLSALSRRQGPYETLSIEELNQKKEETLKKIEAYKGIITKSNVAFFLKRIPELLPLGAWLTNLSINYPEQTSKPKISPSQEPTIKVTILMDGYIYTPDINEQLSLANRLPAGFKSDQEFSRFFQEAKLLTVRKETVDDFTVTYFQISLK